MKLSVVILSKNSGQNLAKTLDSVVFADEIVLVQSSSESIAKAEKLITYKKEFEGDFSKLRNFGLDKSKGDWVLFIDADEIVSSALQKEIREVIKEQDNNYSAYYIKRRDFWWGKELKYGETMTVRKKGLVRLVRKNSGKWHGLVHEVFNSAGSVAQLNGFIDHYPHPTLSEFLASINFYSTLRAKELIKMSKRATVLGIMFYPPAKFISTYVLKRGFMDGVQGFAYSFLMSFHSFLVRAKHYQYSRLS